MLKRNIVILLLVLIPFSVVAFLANQQLWRPYYDQAVAVLAPKAETFTELYFENHLQLPTTLKLKTPSQFSFTIHNLEQKTMEYPIEIQLQNQDNPPEIRVLSTRTVTLQPGEKMTIPVHLTITSYFSNRVKIRVLLKNIDQSIHYWVALQN